MRSHSVTASDRDCSWSTQSPRGLLNVPRSGESVHSIATWQHTNLRKKLPQAEKKTNITILGSGGTAMGIRSMYKCLDYGPSSYFHSSNKCRRVISWKSSTTTGAHVLFLTGSCAPTEVLARTAEVKMHSIPEGKIPCRGMKHATSWWTMELHAVSYHVVNRACREEMDAMYNIENIETTLHNVIPQRLGPQFAQLKPVRTGGI